MELRQKKLVTLRNTPERPLSDLEIVEATIAFANGARLRIEQEADGVMGQVGERSSGPRDSDVREQQQIVSRWLRDALKSPGAVAAEILQREGYSSPIRGPSRLVYRTRGGLHVLLFELFPSVWELVFLGAMLLLDPAREFGKSLCQCHWHRCGRLFYAQQPPRGRPQRKYCRRAHMDLAHNAAGAKRMEKLRGPAGRHK